MKIGEFVEKISHKNFIILFLRRLSCFLQMKITRYLFPFATLFFSLSCWSCVDRAETGPIVSNGRVEVRIAPPPATTRTVLGDDGVTTEWIKGDRIALWAFSDGGSAVFEREPFTFWSNKTGNRGAFFVGSIPAMPTGTYRYYAAYPYPESVSGSRVTYEIPAEQDGTWRGELDIMLASASAPELVPADPDRLDDVNELALRFSHKIHALKVTVPAGRNLFGRPVTMLRVRFPRPVTGRMTWDLAAPDAAPSMEGAGDAVTLRFARPVGEGDSFWVFIAPGDMRGGEVLFTASDGTEFTWPLSSGAFGDCTAGRITPVNLTLPEIRPMKDYRISIDASQLGEPVSEINAVELPDGFCFPSLDLALRRMENLPANSDGTFSMRVFEDMSADFPSEVGLAVGSANAAGVVGKLGTGQCLVSDVTASGCTIKAPYFFFENFAEVPADNSSDDAMLLTPWGLPDWSGARSGVRANTCIMANCHVSTHSGMTNSRSYGRVDTPCLPIRAGKTLALSVSFDIGYDTVVGTMGSGAGNSWAICTFGRTDISQPSVAVAADAAFSETIFSGRAVTKLSDTNNLPDKLSNQRVSGCGPNSRLSWQAYTEKKSWGATTTNVTYRCHLDNIRVTIVP